MVERELPKLIMRVRFPLPAPFFFESVQVADFFVSCIFFREIEFWFGSIFKCFWLWQLYINEPLCKYQLNNFGEIQMMIFQSVIKLNLS